MRSRRDFLRCLLGPAACGAALLFALLITTPVRVTYHEDVAPGGVGEQVLRRLDADFRRGAYPYVAGDPTTYFAMAERPFGDDYLVRRSPFCFRFLEPLLANGLGELGLDGPSAFLVIGAAGLFFAGLAVHSVLRGAGCSASTAAVGGALFVLTPAALKTLVYPHIIDAGSWALMFWAWQQWRRGHPLASAALLVPAVLWRETSALLLLPMIATTVRSSRMRRDVALIGGLMGVVIGVSHLLIRPLQEFPVSLVVARVLDVRRGQLSDWSSFRGAALEYTINALGIVLLVVARRPSWRGRAEDVAPLWLVPAGALLTLTAFNVSRLLVPAALGVIVLTAGAIDRGRPAARVLWFTGLIAVTVAYDIAYVHNTSSWLLLALVGIAVAGVAVLRRPELCVPTEGGHDQIDP